MYFMIMHLMRSSLDFFNSWDFLTKLLSVVETTRDHFEEVGFKNNVASFSLLYGCPKTNDYAFSVW